jgi:hypothetical protein
VKCSKCNEGKKYQFDEIPGFFPNSWYEWDINEFKVSNPSRN